MNKIIAIEFDGVVRQFYNTPSNLGIPVDGALKFLNDLIDHGFRVVCYGPSVLSKHGLRDAAAFLAKHGGDFAHDTYAEVGWAMSAPTNAHLCISTRGVLFTGAFPDVGSISRFQSWLATRDAADHVDLQIPLDEGEVATQMHAHAVGGELEIAFTRPVRGLLLNRVQLLQMLSQLNEAST